MPRILLDGLVFEHDACPVFPTPLRLDLDAGWTGLVGPNGAGKTTLLKLIAGELRPAAGALRFEPERAIVRVVPQSVEDPAPVEAFADDWSKLACRLRDRLELDDGALWRWPELSPGERKRWQIAAALAGEPEVLLCDEPGNHLDARARRLLSAALREFGGVGILVSHDRALLDELCARTLMLEPGGRARLRPGGYSEATAEAEREREHLRDRHAQARADERRLARQLADARRRQVATERSRRSSSRKRDHRDHDASSSARKHRADHAAASADAAVNRLRSAHARSRAALDDFEPGKELGGALFVDWSAPRKRSLLELDTDDLARLRPGPWTRMPTGLRSLSLERDDRVELRGPNGAGKTSLLRTIHARASELLPARRILWLAQERDLAARRRLLTELRALPKAERGRVLEIVASAGVDPDRLLASRAPSPGEARKLELALGLAREAWLLLLDEPANHLDLPAIAAVEAMLVDYPGALVLVSHDRRLAEACTDTVWALDP